MNQNNPVESSQTGIKTTIIGIVLSAFLGVLKLIGGIIGHSYALIADAIESATDVVTSTLLLIGLKWSAKPADENHPYGHGKIEAITALFISLALLVASFAIIKESIEHIQNPHKIPKPFTLFILLFVIISKEIMYHYVLRKAKQTNSEVLKADAIHHRTDAVTSIAAFIGISIAIFGGKGYEVADDWAALFAAIFIIYNALKIARSACGELLDENMSKDLNENIIAHTNKVEGVFKVEQCHSRKMGAFYHVDMHIWVDGKLSVEIGHEIAHQVKNKLKEKIPQILDVHIHIEPIIK